MKKKRKLGRKLLSFVLTLVMVFTTMTGIVPGMSMTALAWDGGPYASLLNKTTVVNFDGKEWYLVENNSTALNAGTVTLLSKECVGASVFGSNKTYSGSTVETYVNNWYTNNIDAKAAVDGSGMFLLTREQALTIEAANVNVLKCAWATGADAIMWWLCTPRPSGVACVLGNDGSVGANEPSKKYGVRPALKLDLSKVTFDSDAKTFELKPPKTAQTVTEPTKATGLTYKKDQAQPLLTKGAEVTTGNTATDSIQYRVGTEETWSTKIPTGTNAGTYSVYYRVLEDETYAEYAPAEPISVTIAKADPETPTGMTGKYGQKLSTVSLPGGWSWADGDTIMNAGVGDYTYKANYNPTDATNYNSLNEVDLTVKVGKGDGTISFGQTVVESTIGGEAPSVYFGSTGDGVVTFTSNNEDVATVDDNGKLTIIGVGETTITASVEDSATYQYATKSVSYKLIVNKRSVSIKTVPTASEITYGQTLADSTLSGGEVLPNIEGTFSWVDSGVAPAVSDSETTEYAVKFTPKNSDIYAESTCNVKVKVKKAAAPATKESLLPQQKPAAKNADDLVYTGEPIELVTAPTADLPKGYKAYYSTDGENWSNDIPKEKGPGSYTVSVNYVSESGNYEDILLDDISVTITVDKSILGNVIKEAKDYKDEITKKNTDDIYTTVISDLGTAISTAETAYNNEGITDDAVASAIDDLTSALNKAKADVKKIDDQRAADAVITLINALPVANEVTIEDKDEIEAARAAYNSLTADQKNKVTNLEKLTNAEAAWVTAYRNAKKNAADGLVSDEDSEAAKALVTNAKNDIDSITYDQSKGLDGFKADVDAIITKVTADVKDQKAADAVITQINALHDANQVTTGDKDKIEAARAAYNSLTGDQKSKVTDETLKKLTDAEDALAAAIVSDTINALPTAGEVTTANKDAVEAARKAFDDLTDVQKAYVKPETLKKLTDAEDRLKILQVMSEVSAKTGSDMTYTGNPIQLINVPTTKLPEGYKMVYAVTTENKAPTDENLYTTDIPTKTEVGTYYVWYKVKGDGDHADTEPKSVQVTITEIEITSIRLKAVNGTTMVPGASQQIEAVLMPSNASAKSLSWKSSNDKVATVSGGLVTVKPENEIDWGTSSSIEVEIKASSAKAEASITILVKKVEKEVTGVKIDPLSVKEDPKPGDTFRLTALIEPYDATDQTVTWESSDTTVAEISASGMVTVKKFGTATIKATSSSDPKMQASITLNVKEVKVESITINAAGGDDYLVKGRSTRLSVTVKPDNATEKGIKWTSSDEKVAVVSGNVVTGVGAGKVTITATSASDPSKTAALTFIVFDSKDALYVEFTDGSEYTYTGRGIEPVVNVYYHGKRLMCGTDYTVSYKNNVNAGEGTDDKKAARAIVTGKTVAAKAEATFCILPVDIGDKTLVSTQEINIASGKTASPVLFFGGKKLRSKAGWERYYIGKNENGADMYGSYYTPKSFDNPYEKTKFNKSRPITVYGSGNFTGERELWVNVKSKAEINKMPGIKVKSFTPKARLYNGKPQPLSSDEIVVTDASDRSKILEVNKDYYISYPSDITSVGKVNVGIIGMGDYKGSYSKSYKIEAAKEESDAVESVSISFNDAGNTYKAADGKTYASFVYDPAGVYPAVNVTVKFKDGSEKTLIAGRDYKVTYKNNKKAGAANKNKPATATVAFKGNYKKIKSKNKEFFIEQADLGSAAVSAQDKAVTRASGKYPLSVPAADYSGVQVNKREYTVSYNSAGSAIDKNSKYSLDAGKSVSVNVTITAKANANYKGSASCSYTVTRPDTAAVNLSKAKVMICKDGDSSYKKVTKLSFTGLPVVIGEDEFSGYKLYVYTGKSLKNPTAVLKEGTDYTVSYSNNVRAGKATVIINAKEGSTAYTGSKTFNFRIVKGTMRWVK